MDRQEEKYNAKSKDIAHIYSLEELSPDRGRNKLKETSDHHEFPDLKAIIAPDTREE